jgi:hypothetical protein
MPLRAGECRAIAGPMKIRGISACLGLALLLPGCRKPEEVSVDESRELTTRDSLPKLHATSSERFEEPGSSPILAGTVPAGWLAQPSNSFRLLSYRFGTGGDVAVGISAGDLPGNVNRWLGQFGADPLDAAGIAALAKVEVTGVAGVWVEAAGNYSPGMGQEPRPGQALAGVVADAGGRIITVKMTGPADEVAAQKEPLKAFIAGLRNRGE